MCSLSYFAKSNKIIITSNRDEHIDRASAISPQHLIFNGISCYCPIDPASNGTWFSVREDGLVLVLLNGADTAHKPNPPYRISRGLILVELLGKKNPEIYWEDINLDGIEPFTIVLYKNSKLIQCIWNGNLKSSYELNATSPKLWCSSTLYSDIQYSSRLESFHTLINNKGKEINDDDILQLHKNPDSSSKPGFLLNRNDTMLTKNIIQCVITNNNFSLKHLDVINQKEILISDLFS